MKQASTARSVKKKPQTLRILKKEPLGLCSCCKSFQSCTYPKGVKRPVLQCAEFSGIVRPPLRAAAPRSWEVPKKPKKTKQQGLCGLCEDRSVCMYPKPEGGVWHCEDYR
jgi:hypothetical protein